MVEIDPIGQQSSSDHLITRFLSKSALESVLLLGERKRRRKKKKKKKKKRTRRHTRGQAHYLDPFIH